MSLIIDKCGLAEYLLGSKDAVDTLDKHFLSDPTFPDPVKSFPVQHGRRIWMKKYWDRDSIAAWVRTHREPDSELNNEFSGEVLALAHEVLKKVGIEV